MTEPELNERGYPKILDKVLEYTGTTYEDIEEMKWEEREEFSRWVDEHNAKNKIFRDIRANQFQAEDTLSFKLWGGRHDERETQT